MGNGNTWKEWSKHIIRSIDRLNRCSIEEDDKITNIRDDVIELKLRCKILWGVVGAVLGTLATLIVLVLAGVVRYG
jgi:hypothetical protein